MKMKRWAALVLGAAMTVSLLGGCGGEEASSPAQSGGQGQEDAGQALTEVTLVLDWTPNTNHTGFYVALDQGYYEEAGLDVQIMQPPESGAEALVAAGQAQFCISFQESLASALTADSPLPLTAVAAIIDHNDSGLISLKEKGIDSPSKMEGMTYASWDTPIERAILDDVITLDGGDPLLVNYVPNTVTDVVSALQTNMDVVWIYYSWDGIATELAGLDTNYISFREIDPVLDFYTPILAANNEFLETQPEVARAFLAATAKGYEYAIENPESAAEILVGQVPELDPELIQASQAYLADKYQAEKAQWGTIDEARWTAFYDWMYEEGLIPEQLGSRGFSNDYLPQA